jgi:hypothetical protein
MREMIKRGLKAERLRQLLPRHHVYLFALEPGGERFARLFVESWKRLPYYARRLVLRHWKRDTPADMTLKPQIELLSGWSGRAGGRGLSGAKAAAGGLGYRLVFWTRIVDVYPDELVRDLIAHELAHIFQWASGWNIDRADPIVCEQHANDLVEAWGFSSTEMDEWDVAHGITTALPNLDKLDEAERAKVMKRQWALVRKYGR